MKWQKKFLRNWNQTLQKKIKVLYIIPPDFIWNLQISFFSPYSTLSLWQEGGFVDMMSCVNEPSSAPPYFNFSQEKTSSTVLLTILAFPRRLFLPPLSSSFVVSLGIITTFLTLLPVFYKDDTNLNTIAKFSIFLWMYLVRIHHYSEWLWDCETLIISKLSWGKINK